MCRSLNYSCTEAWTAVDSLYFAMATMSSCAATAIASHILRGWGGAARDRSQWPGQAGDAGADGGRAVWVVAADAHSGVERLVG